MEDNEIEECMKYFVITLEKLPSNAMQDCVEMFLSRWETESNETIKRALYNPIGWGFFEEPGKSPICDVIEIGASPESLDRLSHRGLNLFKNFAYHPNVLLDTNLPDGTFGGV